MREISPKTKIFLSFGEIFTQHVPHSQQFSAVKGKGELAIDSGACSHTIPKPLRIKAFMGSVPNFFIIFTPQKARASAIAFVIFHRILPLAMAKIEIKMQNYSTAECRTPPQGLFRTGFSWLDHVPMRNSGRYSCRIPFDEKSTRSSERTIFGYWSGTDIRAENI